MTRRIDTLYEIVAAAGSLEEATAIKWAGWSPKVGREAVKHAIAADLVGRGEGNTRLWPHSPSMRRNKGIEMAQFRADNTEGFTVVERILMNAAYARLLADYDDDDNLDEVRKSLADAVSDAAATGRITVGSIIARIQQAELGKRRAAWDRIVRHRERCPKERRP